MIKKGDIAVNKKTKEVVEITTAYGSKRDICPDNPESVAILSVHRIKYLSGPNIGKTITLRTGSFTRNYDVFPE